METSKICNKCGQLKPLTEYHKKKDTKDGYRHTCKSCVKEFMTVYNQENKEKILDYHKNRYQEKKEDILEYKKEYYQKNQEELREKKKIYREENRDLISERQKLKYQNDEEYREKVKNYKKNNKNEWNLYMKEYRTKYPHEIAWRSLLHTTLRRLGQHKQHHTIKLLGYSAIELKEHLESLFLPQMNWDNYGTFWEIDHIKPVSSFPKNSDVSEVCALSNLQPLPVSTIVLEDVLYIGNRNKSGKTDIDF